MNSKYLKGIGINILLLGIVSFFNDMSSEMIIPILPMFIAALGGTGIIIGLIGGLRDSISSILKVICGYWSDKIGKRKIFVSTGYLSSIFFKLMLGFSTLWQHILIFASMERIGKGIRTAPRDAIIADSMPEERGKGFGIHRSLDTLGAIMGSIIVFILFWFLGLEFTAIVLIAALIGFSQRLWPEIPSLPEEVTAPLATQANNLAEFYRTQARFHEAQPLYQHALEIGEKFLGPDHPAVAVRLNNLASFYQATNRLTQVEPLMKRVIEIFKKAFGPDHHDEVTVADSGESVGDHENGAILKNSVDILLNKPFRFIVKGRCCLIKNKNTRIL